MLKLQYTTPLYSCFGLPSNVWEIQPEVDDNETNCSYNFMSTDVPCDWKERKKESYYETYLDTKDYLFLRNRCFLSRHSVHGKTKFLLRVLNTKSENYVIEEEITKQKEILSYANKLSPHEPKQKICQYLENNLFTLYVTRVDLGSGQFYEISNWDLCGIHKYYANGKIIKSKESNFLSEKRMIVPDRVLACMYDVFHDSLLFSMSPACRLNLRRFFSREGQNMLLEENPCPQLHVYCCKLCDSIK